jgi:hypothetical protein
MSRSVIPYDPSKIHPYAEVEKFRPIRPASAVSRASPIIPSRTSASNKILPSDYIEKVLGDEVRALLIECYKVINLNKNLRALLKLLTDNCSKYIDGVFAGNADYNDYDVKYKYGTYSFYNLKKFYYENRMSKYMKGCSNYNDIKSIYSTCYYYFKGDIDKEERNRRLRAQLLNITSMKPYIHSIIKETPIPETFSQSSLSGGKTNKQRQPPQRKPQPTKLLFGKVRRIYKKSGDKKEYVKHKGLLITIKQYKDIRVKATKNRGK